MARSKRVFRVQGGANAWAISPDGRWAIAWTEVNRVASPDPTQGFQTISIIDLESTSQGGTTEKASRLAIGFRPFEISFETGAPHAFVVTADGIDVVDLAATGGPQVMKHVNLDAPAGAVPTRADRTPR